MFRAMVGIGLVCGLADRHRLPLERADHREEPRRVAAARRSSTSLPGAASSGAFRFVEGKAVRRRAAQGKADAGGADIVYAAYDAEGKLVGVAIAAAGMGYQDTIRLLYGYSPDKDAIVGFQVLESRETPGLGDRIGSDPDFLANFAALSVKLDAALAAARASAQAREARREARALAARRHHRRHRLVARRDRHPDPRAPPSGFRASSRAPTSCARGAEMSDPRTKSTPPPRPTTSCAVSGRRTRCWCRCSAPARPSPSPTRSRNALAMGLATLVVLVMSNALISAIRKFIPKEVRIASYILVIATLRHRRRLRHPGDQPRAPQARSAPSSP